MVLRHKISVPITAGAINTPHIGPHCLDGGKHMFLEGEASGELKRRCGVVCHDASFACVFFLCFWADNRPTRAGAALRAAPSERGWAIIGAIERSLTFASATPVRRSAPTTVRPLARDPWVLIGWPLPLGFGLNRCLLLARRGRVYVQFTTPVRRSTTSSAGARGNCFVLVGLLEGSFRRHSSV